MYCVHFEYVCVYIVCVVSVQCALYVVFVTCLSCVYVPCIMYICDVYVVCIFYVCVVSVLCVLALMFMFVCLRCVCGRFFMRDAGLCACVVRSYVYAGERVCVCCTRFTLVFGGSHYLTTFFYPLKASHT